MIYTIDPPVWVMAAASVNEGMRCLKQDRRYPPVRQWQPVTQHSHRVRGRVVDLTTIAPTVHVSPVKENLIGNLPFAEYQFWIGTPATFSAIARCRACGGQTYSEKQRRDHMEETKHTKWLQEAYGHLKSCVICSRVKARKKWGVPLCEGGCTQTWMYETVKLLPLDLALTMAWEKVKDFGIAPRRPE